VRYEAELEGALGTLFQALPDGKADNRLRRFQAIGVLPGSDTAEMMGPGTVKVASRLATKIK
jgi:hypothetical protein